MFEFEFDEALFALKYKRPAYEPLFQLPPTYRTCQPEDEFAQKPSAPRQRRQSLIHLKFTLCKAPGVATPGPPQGIVRGYASHRRRAETSENEPDEALLALKYKRPANEPLSQSPPTYRTRQPEDESA